MRFAALCDDCQVKECESPCSTLDPEPPMEEHNTVKCSTCGTMLEESTANMIDNVPTYVCNSCFNPAKYEKDEFLP